MGHIDSQHGELTIDTYISFTLAIWQSFHLNIFRCCRIDLRCDEDCARDLSALVRTMARLRRPPMESSFGLL